MTRPLTRTMPASQSPADARTGQPCSAGDRSQRTAATIQARKFSTRPAAMRELVGKPRATFLRLSETLLDRFDLGRRKPIPARAPVFAIALAHAAPFGLGNSRTRNVAGHSSMAPPLESRRRVSSTVLRAQSTAGGFSFQSQYSPPDIRGLLPSCFTKHGTSAALHCSTTLRIQETLP